MPYRDTPEFVWPDKSAAAAAALGIPAALLAMVKGPLRLEHFEGNETASRSEKQYVTSSTGGAVVAATQPNPDTGDTVTAGQFSLSVIPSPVAPLGTRRITIGGVIGADGFSAARPTIWARRFRTQTAQPAATDFLMLAGICRWPTPEIEPLEGPQLLFDPTLGVESWVIRARRAGVAIQSVNLASWDPSPHVAGAGFHVGGFLHMGTEIIPFFDGVAFAPLAGPECQPAAVCSVQSHGQIAFAAGALAPIEECDWILWGR